MRGVRKQRAKQIVRRVVGEPYVGKRLKQIRVGKYLDRLALRPRDILDAGTEDAAFVYWLADRYPDASVTAVDIDQDAIDACIHARPAKYVPRVSFEARSFGALEPESFDLITVFDVLEHIDDDTGAVRALAGALRPGGTLLVHVPRNRWRTFRGELKTIADADAWQVNPGHVRSGYSPEQLAALLANVGLGVDDLQTWLGRWGVLAHEVYAKLERPALLRLASIPVTVAAARIEARMFTPEGNTVFARATKPALSADGTDGSSMSF